MSDTTLHEELLATAEMRQLSETIETMWRVAGESNDEQVVANAYRLTGAMLSVHGLSVEGEPSMEGLQEWLGKSIKGLGNRLKSLGQRLDAKATALYNDGKSIEKSLAALRTQLKAVEGKTAPVGEIRRVGYAKDLLIHGKPSESLGRDIDALAQHTPTSKAAEEATQKILEVRRLDSHFDALREGKEGPLANALADHASKAKMDLYQGLLDSATVLRKPDSRFKDFTGEIRMLPRFIGDWTVFLGVKKSEKDGNFVVTDLWRGLVEDRPPLKDANVEFPVLAADELTAAIDASERLLAKAKETYRVLKDFSDAADSLVKVGNDLMHILEITGEKDKQYLEAMTKVFRYSIHTMEELVQVYTWFANHSMDTCRGVVNYGNASIKKYE